MAHDLYIMNNGRAAFAGRERAWHGLGTDTMTDDHTKQDWIQASGFDFTIERSPVMYHDAYGNLRTDSTRDVLFRGDDGKLLNTVSKRYKVVQPGEVVDYFDSLIEEAGFKRETMGVLANGAKYWAQAKIADDFSIAGDQHAAYALLATSCDGSIATSGALVINRVVCDNTLRAALLNCANVVKTRHSTEFNPEAMKKQLGLIREHGEESITSFADAMETLAKVEIDPVQAATYFATLIDDKKALAVIAENETRTGSGGETFAELLQSPVRAPLHSVRTIIDAGDRKLAGLWDTYQNGVGQDTPAARGTMYGAVQAVTRHVDHVQGRSADTRQASAMFGVGSSLKQAAFSQAVQYAQAA